MTIYAAIGAGAVILFTCIGITTIAVLAINGVLRLSSRLEIGKTYEDAGVRDVLSITPRDEISIGRRK